MTQDDRTPKKEWPYEWQPVFLRWLRKKGNVTGACDKAKITRSWAYEVRESDPAFAAAWDEALQEATERLEMEARRRAHDGVLEPVFQGGMQVGSVRKYSDTLLIFLLKAHAPEKYRENFKVDHSGKVEVEVDDPRTELLSRITRLATRNAVSAGDPGDDAGSGEGAAV